MNTSNDHGLYEPIGSCKNERTDSSGVWNQIAAIALYSPSAQNNYNNIKIISIVIIK